jgi:hypothetical protein
LGDAPQWSNKHILPPLIRDKWKNPKETTCLKVLIKRVIELRWARLETCPYAEEFILRWIRPLNYQERLAFGCP